jgi:hypothetical protein
VNPHKKMENRRGAALVEMTLVGIPIIFVLISVFEISRGMWMYETSAYAVKVGVRFAMVHGIDCITKPGVLSNCPTSINEVSQKIKAAAIGLPSTTTRLTFTPGATSAAPTSCYIGGTNANGPYGSLNGCSTYTTTWPPDDGSGLLNGGGKSIRIDIKTPFKSALAMLWPGAGSVKFAATDLGGSSADYIQF